MRVQLDRTLSAKPQDVFRAWLDPDLLVRWMAPGGSEIARAEVDERVGGHFRIFHTYQGAAVGGFDAELLELVPDERISWRWGFVGPQWRDAPSYDSVLTVTLREAPGGGTLLSLVHERLEDLAAAMPDVAGNVANGWASALDKLAAAVGGPA